jgi:hypothetical protein
MRGMHRALIASALFAIGLLATGSSVPAGLSGTRSANEGIAGLTGHILFTRAGGSYGDEALFVARADGTGQRRISKLEVTCCPFGRPATAPESCSAAMGRAGDLPRPRRIWTGRIGSCFRSRKER